MAYNIIGKSKQRQKKDTTLLQKSLLISEINWDMIWFQSKDNTTNTGSEQFTKKVKDLNSSMVLSTTN